MIELLQLNSLPEQSFPTFTANYLRAPHILWLNRDSEGVVDPNECAVCLPCDGEDPHSFHPRTVCLKAERYGGGGLANNGGGVRCGLLGGVQIKGTGKNLLAGANTDRWHKHGALSIQDAIKEAVWSEILGAALPYGAARCYAIIGTGTSFAVEVGEHKLPGFASRALLLREPILRPAHFMRSIFEELENPGAVWGSDVERTRTAIRQLISIYLTSGVPLDRVLVKIGDGLIESFTRIAEQLAASQARRIIHGSLTASNFGLNGKLLDFGTTSALAGYHDVTVAPGSASFWTQERAIVEIIGDLTFYIAKYSDAASVGLEFQYGMTISNAFKHAYSTALRSEFLQLCGARIDETDQVEEEVKQRMWCAMKRLISREHRACYLYYGDNRHQMRETTLSIAEVLRNCAIAATSEVMFARLVAIGLEDDFAQEFSSAYISFCRAIAHVRAPAERRTIVHAINVLHKNQARCEFWRKSLDHSIDAAVRNGLDISREIDHLVSLGIAYWAGWNDPHLRLDGGLIQGNKVHMFADGRVTGSAHSEHFGDIVEMVPQLQMEEPQKEALLNMAKIQTGGAMYE